MTSFSQTSQKLFANVLAFPRDRDATRDKDELAFLPAALEIVETPPSPVGRTIAFSIMALFCIALTWAFFGRIDIVASARGKIIPTGHTKVIQPFETGVVRAIHVRDGQFVKAGEVLIELDPTMNSAETSHLQSDLIAAQLDVARLRAEVSNGDVLANFDPPEGAPASLVETARKFLLNQTREEEAKLGVLDHQKVEKEAQRATIVATVDRLEASLPVMKERLDIVETLYQHSTGSKANYLQMLQDYVEKQHELYVEKSKINEAGAALSAIIEERVHID